MTVPSALETRATLSDFQVSTGQDGGTVVTGYAAKFNTRSQDLGGFVETIAPGAFTRALEESHDVRALINHDPNLVLGRTTAGTLRLTQDDIGLRYEVDLPNTTAAKDLTESLKRKDISQSSFSFRAIREDWSYDTDGRELRTLQDLELCDVSPVTYPAYLDTVSELTQRSRSNFKDARNSGGPSAHFVDLEMAHDALTASFLNTFLSKECI
ncbi:HK97 family phage prohead protease [Streptomyces sp. NPDC057909]|uniref:HK97 family phage prohead protease n=1 Tax=Streptomyces sp. NPDC057909 TaxID=3346277 RepID=UPI0036EBF783